MYSLNGFNTFNPAISGNPTYHDRLAYMNVGVLRLHSWEIMNDSSEPNGWIDKANKRWDAEKIGRALASMPQRPQLLINIPGWPEWMDTDKDGYLDADQFDAFAAFCAELVRIVNVEHGIKVKYWEPLNERDDPYYVHYYNSGEPDRLGEMIDMYNRAAKAMKAVDPSILTGGPAIARPDLFDQTRRFVQAAVKETSPTTLDFYSYHFYGSGDLSQSDETIYNRTSNPDEPQANTLATTTATLRSILDEASPERRIPLYLDEYNVSWSWTNNDPRMHNHKGAVFDALAMISAQKHGADGTMAWNDYDGVYGKINGDDYRLQPNAHAFQLLNNYFVGKVTAASSGDERAIVAYAVKGEKTKFNSVMLVNRTDEVQGVQANFIDGPANKRSVKQHQISLAGYAITSSDWNLLTKQTMYLPPHSVTVLTDSEVNPTIDPPALQSSEPAPPGTNEPGPGPETNLTGKVEASSSANLTSEGTLDWALWGANPDTVTSAVYKAGPKRLISDVELIGQPKTYAYTPQWWGTHQATWSDGQPVSNGDHATSALVTEGQEKGFRFTVPAGTEERQLKIYLGVMGAKGVLEAELSDGSAPKFSTSYEDSDPNVINNSGGATAKVVTLIYKAASEEQTLTVTYKMNYNHWGNTLWLQAAALSVADTIEPAAPQGSEAYGVTATSAAIRWEAATDNVGVAGYGIFKNGQYVGSSLARTTSYFVQGLEPQTVYTFTVKARDAAGNWSEAGTPVAVTTTADTIAPTRPAELKATVTEQGAVIQWGSSYDNDGSLAYQVWRDGKLVGNVSEKQFTDANQSKNKVYRYEVVAMDSAGNVSDGAKLMLQAGKPWKAELPDGHDEDDEK